MRVDVIIELIRAEDRARRLFAEGIKRGLVVPGKTEQELSDELCELASKMFGTRRFWHKRIVRAGKNTVLPYSNNPENLELTHDDIVFFDFGPVFEEWEADLGQTLVLGDDPRKQKLAADVARAWDKGAAYFRDYREITAAQLYDYVSNLAREMGWTFGHVHCGHLIGQFPHEKTEGDDASLYLRADNGLPMRRTGVAGTPLRWILEIHFIDRAAGIGGFQEAVLLEADELDLVVSRS